MTLILASILMFAAACFGLAWQDWFTIALFIGAVYFAVLWARDVHLEITEERNDEWVI